MCDLLKQGERLEEIGFGGLKLIQNPEWFCFGIDAVLLADFTELKKDSRVADLGTGTGIIPLILSRKVQVNQIVGIEIQEKVAEMAKRSVRLNGLEGIIEIVNLDVKDAVSSSEKSTFDVVVSNPPYMGKESGLKNEDSSKAIARHEISAGLEDFIRAAYDLLKDKGSFFLIHRPHRLVDILTLCRTYRLEPKKIRFVHPNKDSKPNIMLLQCIKHGGAELKFMDPLYIYEKMGVYTAEILKMYGK